MTIKASSKYFLFTILCSFILLNHCSNEGESSGASPSVTSENVQELADEEAVSRSADQKSDSAINQKKSPGSDGQSSIVADLGSVGLGKMEIAEQRLLEYQISLVYRTEDFFQTRNDLLEIISKNGFIVNSTTNSGTHPQIHSNIQIKSDRILETLAQMNRLGQLESESIRTIDHTQNAVLQQQKITREQIRQSRRSRAATNTGLKDWQNRERLLSQSEDQEDVARHEKWKIEDKVSYANIQLTIYGPKQAPMIEVPLYKKAIIDLVNFLLDLSYISIYLLPFGLFLTGLILIIRKKGYLAKKQKDQD